MTKTFSPEAIAAARFKRLAVVRFAGIGLTMVGVAIIAGKIDLPRLLGLLLVVAGVFDALVFPVMLVRRWKRAEPGRGGPA